MDTQEEPVQLQSGMNVMKQASTLVVVALILFVAAGCYTREAKGPELVEAFVDASAGSLRLSLIVFPKKFVIGEVVVLEIYVTNPNTYPIEVDFPSSCQVEFEVTDASGAVVAPDRTCDEHSSQFRLGAEDYRLIRMEWSVGENYFNAFTQLTPGKYNVTAGFVGGDGTLYDTVNPIRIEVYEGPLAD